MKNINLTFQEIKLFKTILDGNFELSNFTPKLFHEVTQDNTTFSYKDIFLLLNFYKDIYGASEYISQFPTLRGLTMSINNVRTMIANLKGFVDRYYSEASNYGSDNQSIEIKASNYYNDVYKNNTSTMDSSTYIHNVIIKGAKYNYLQSIKFYVHNPKQHYAETVSYLNRANFRYIKSKVHETLKYENMFNFVIYAPTGILQDQRNYLGPSVAYFKTTPNYRTRQCLYERINNTNNVNGCRFSNQKPFFGVFYDALVGNTGEFINSFARPIYKNNKFSHFDKNVGQLSAKNGLKQTQDTAFLYDYITKKGFNMKELKVVNKDHADDVKVYYDGAELLINSWNCMEKNEKMLLVKQNTAIAITRMMDQVLAEKEYIASTSTPQKDLVDMFNCNILLTQADNFCNMCTILSNFYLSETNLEVKAVLESSILAIREIAKKETKGRAIPEVLTHDPRNMQILENLKILQNDNESFPQEILEKTGFLEDAKKTARAYAYQTVATSTAVSCETKKKYLSDEEQKIDDTIAHLERNCITKLINYKEIAQLRKDKSIFNPAKNMMTNLYDNGGNFKMNQDGNTMIDVLNRKIANSEYSKDYDDEYITRHAEGNGIRHDNSMTLHEYNRLAAFEKNMFYNEKNNVSSNTSSNTLGMVAEGVITPEQAAEIRFNKLLNLDLNNIN